MKNHFLYTLAIAFLFVSATAQSETSLPSRQLELVSSDFKHPWSMAFISSNSLLITEKPGSLRLIDLQDKTSQLINNPPSSDEFGQGGLLDIALHPNFANNHWVYLSFSKREGKGVGVEVIRATLENGQLVGQQLIFKQSPKLTKEYHFGSRLAFDDQGYLWISLGDRFEKEQAQDPSHHVGKIIRLKDDGSVPADNPHSKNPNFAPEVFSFGHRNVQGLAFNTNTGKMWAHEHGPQGGDEINIIESGKNYGWPVITYGVNYFIGTKIGEGTHKAGMEQPIYKWIPSIAPSGMAFCRCEKYPGWGNSLWIGSLKFSTLVRLQLKDNNIISEERPFKDIGRVRDVRISPDGFIYLLAGNQLYRVLPN